jgi:tetratricopeptide (TPR) repeat protein
MGPKITQKRKSRVKEINEQVAARPKWRVRAQSLFWLWLFLGAAAVCLVVFSPALRGRFVFDDYHLPFTDADAASAPLVFWMGGARPLVSLTYWLNFVSSGSNSFSYHVVNILIHAAVGTVVFFLLNQILAIAGLKGRTSWWPLFGAAVFLLHPLQTESVDYIAGRSELVYGLFLFAAWLVFLRHFESRISVVVSAAILLLFIAAVLGKESAVALPAILLATDFYFGPGSIRDKLARRYKLYLPLLAGGILGAAVILRGIGTSTSVGVAASGVNPWQYAITECRSILLYLRLFFFPGQQSADWQLPFFHSLTDNFAWAYVLGLLAVGAVAAWLFPRNRLASFGLAVFLLALAPTSSFVPIRDAMAERRVYVPLIGLIIAVIGMCIQLRVSKAALAAVMMAALAFLSWRSFDRSYVWSSDLLLWQDALRQNPRNARAHLGVGSALLMAGDCAAAAREFSSIVSEEGWETIARWNLASAYQCNNQLPAALGLFRALALLNPTAVVYNRIGSLEAQLGDTEEALASFNRALDLDPSNDEAYDSRKALISAIHESKNRTNGSGDRQK